MSRSLCEGSWWGNRSFLALASAATWTAKAAVEWPQSDLVDELVLGVLAVMQQKVDVVAQFEHGI